MTTASNIARKGMTYRTASPEDFLTLHHTGLTAAQIAERLGCTPRTVVRLRGRYGVAQPPPDNRPVTEDWKARVRAMLDDGASVSDVCRTLGTTHDTVKRHFPDAGWDPRTTAQFARAVRTTNELLRRHGHGPLKPLDHAH